MQHKPIDIASVCDGPLTAIQIRVMSLCALIGVVDGYDTLAAAYAAPMMRSALNISPAVLGWVFSSALIGGIIAMFLGGPVSDRVGRRPVLIIQTAIFGFFTLLSAQAGSASSLLVFRFFAGFGFGLALTVSYALVSEYAPARIRVLAVALVTIGFSLGAGSGGLISSWLIKTHDWRTIFYFGGSAALVLMVLIIVALPESLQFLVVHGKATDRVLAIVKKMRPALFAETVPTFFAQQRLVGHSPIVELFREGRLKMTTLLWIINFMNLLELYIVQQWLPVFIHQSGIEMGAAVSAGAVLQTGSVIGALTYSRLIDKRGNAFRVFAFLFVGGALSFVMLSFADRAQPLVMASVLLLGMFVLGTQIALKGVSTALYPSAIRATGASCATAVGQIGGAFGLVMGGLLLQTGYSPKQIFLMAVGPALISMVCSIALVSRTAAKTDVARAPAGDSQGL